MEHINIKTPIGEIKRPNPFTQMSNDELLKTAITQNENGFIDPVLFRNIELRGIYSLLQKMLNPNMSGVLSLINNYY
jgi:hypothetical protein